MSNVRLTGHLLGLLGSGFMRGEIPLSGVRFALRRQRVVSRVFRHAKHARVGNRIFVDPFAPHFPSPYFTTVIRNFTQPTIPPPPNYAQVSITNLCPCRCFHCHVQNTQRGDMPRETVLGLIDALVAHDFPMLFFVGGEPFSRFDDLVAFVQAASPRMDTRMFTSGVGATPARLARLREAGLVGVYVSLDAADPGEHNAKRNHPQAFASACDAIRQAADLGFYVSVVCCTTATMARDGSYRAVVDLAERLGAHSIQLNEIRPVGNAGEAASRDVFLTDDDKASLIAFMKEQNRSSRRISIAMPWYLEEPYNLGCMATSAQKVYIDAHGHVQPCELLKVSLGNVQERPFGEIGGSSARSPATRSPTASSGTIGTPSRPRRPAAAAGGHVPYVALDDAAADGRYLRVNLRRTTAGRGVLGGVFRTQVTARAPPRRRLRRAGALVAREAAQGPVHRPGLDAPRQRRGSGWSRATSSSTWRSSTVTAWPG